MFTASVFCIEPRRKGRGGEKKRGKEMLAQKLLEKTEKKKVWNQLEAQFGMRFLSLPGGGGEKGKKHSTRRMLL